MALPEHIRAWWLSSERFRYLVALTLALLLMVVLFSLPIYRDPTSVHISFYRQEPIHIEPEQNPSTRSIPESDITRWTPSTPKKPEAQAPPEEKEASDSPSSSARPGLKLLKAEEVLDFAQEQPGIVGGLRALYLRIQYPRAAREQGIEGRVIVEFIVEKDGTPSHIRVLQSAHPLLDSAAVQAIRRTTFIPGKQGGVPVRVRMRLPIRFRLLDSPLKTDSTRTDTQQTGGTDGVNVVPLE